MQEKQDQQDLRELSESREFDPRVSEYLKEKLCFWRKDFGVVSTDGEERLDEQVSSGPAETPDRREQWRKIFFAGFVFVLIAQIIFEFKLGNPPWLGILFGLAGLVTLFFVFYSNDIALPGCAAVASKKAAPFNYLALTGAVLISVFSFFLWRNSGFGLMQVLVWLVSIALLGYASFSGGEGKQADAEGEPLLSHQIKRESWRELFSDKRYLTVCVLAIVIVLLFQILFIRKTPVELVSQQVEAFLAVDEIAAGSRALLFPRNVVSEPLGYYWLALVSRFFSASMRISAFHVANILIFCIGLAFLFHLAKLLFDKWVAIVVVFLFGVGFWPILQNTALLGSSLVFPLLSAALYYLFRGLLREKRGDIFLFGVISGLGLFANKLFLMMPILALLMIFIWWIFTRKQNRFLRVLAWFGLAVLTMVVVAGPFMATVSLNPAVYIEPILSRISDLEVNIEGHAFVIFSKNLFQAMGMLNWSNRSGWVDGIANRPALDLVSAVFFLIGLVWLIARMVKEKAWPYIALFVTGILFLVPSALSIAFPLENPSLSRAYGMAIPAMFLAAVGLVLVAKWLGRSKYTRIVISVVCAFVIIFFNYQLLHGVYVDNYRQNAWNAREMSETVLKFEQNYGDDGQAWLLGYPYWVDERAVAIMAGKAPNSLLLNLDDIHGIVNQPGAKLFIMHLEANDSLNTLKTVFPNGVESMVASELENKDYRIYFVPEN